MRPIPLAILVLLAATTLATAPLYNPYWMHVAIISMIFAILAASWSLLAGYAGLFSLGHMAMASIGGYTSALLVKWYGIPIPVGMASGTALAVVLGAGIGWICLRMTGPYLAITLGFAEIVRIIMSNEDAVTNGMAGMRVKPLFESASRLPYFYLGFAVLALSLLLMGLIVRSRWGLFLRAVREDEQAAAASGVAVARFRILAFAISSGFAGFAGTFYGHYIGIMVPSLGGLDLMAVLVVMTVSGGIERLSTAVGGAIAIEFLLELLREYAQWRLPIFGAMLLLTMRFARNGLLTPFWLQFLRLGMPLGSAAATEPLESKSKA